MIRFREFKKDDWRDARHESLQLSQRCQCSLFPKIQSSKFSLDKYLQRCLGSVEGWLFLKSHQSFSFGNQNPQVSHFYELYYGMCRAPQTLAVSALDRNAGFTIFLWKQTQLMKVSSPAVASPYSHPASLNLGWVCTGNVAAVQTRPQKPDLLVFAFETEPEALLLTCSLSWELQQRPQTTVVAIKIVS